MKRLERKYKILKAIDEYYKENTQDEEKQNLINLIPTKNIVMKLLDINSAMANRILQFLSLESYIEVSELTKREGKNIFWIYKLTDKGKKFIDEYSKNNNINA
jgi:predicted transcriptional regulator